MILIVGVCPANTPSTSPYVLRRQLPFGKVKRITIITYPGSENALYIRMFLGAFQKVPESPGQWLPAAGQPLALEEEIEITRESNTLEVQAYNLDAAYDHAFAIIIEYAHEVR